MNIRDKNVLVTGSDGFIGSHLVETLLEEGCNVRAFVYYNSFNSWGWLDTFSREKLESLDVFTGDVRDPNGIRKAMEGVDIVFHLAALIGIPFSYHSPDTYVDTNVKGTLNVLQAARDMKTPKIVVTSTSEVYGTAKNVPIEENHPFQGQSPYSATKIAADRLSEAFFRSFDLPVTIARPFNTYGPRQSARAVIPTIITQLLNGVDSVKLGSLQPTRDLVFVKDTAKAFVEIAKKDGLAGEEINIATQTEISIGDLAKMLINMINPEAVIKDDPERRRPVKSEVKRLLGSNKKIMNLTSWKPSFTLEEGLSETIKWFRNKENVKFYKTGIYNV